MNLWRKRIKELKQYPSAVVGLLIIFILVFISVFAIIYMPYEEAITLWRGGRIWEESPRNARPVWVDWFSRDSLPRTVILDSADFAEKKTIEKLNGVSQFEIILPLDYRFDGFPRELNIFLEAEFNGNSPHVGITWLTPDGREYEASEFSMGESHTFRLDRDTRLQRQFPGETVREAILSDPNYEGEGLVPLKGEHQIIISGYFFDEETTLNVRAVFYGQVHGMAGTDHRRREIIVALFWGTPVALAFGILAAVGTTITTMIMAAVGVWYGRWVDALIQRITEVNLILPVLPILVMVGMLHSRSLWVMLGIVILLGIFSAAIKTYRAMFLQIKDAPFIEAARSYGTGNLRIIFLYLIPKIIPTLIPSFVTAIPTYIFLEASLALLGLGDPILPTWGKLLQDALHGDALYNGYYYWILQPAVLLMITGLGFAMTGFALDRIFNPRLRRL